MSKNPAVLFVIEDDKIFLEMISDYVSAKFPYLKIHRFENGEEALQQLQLDPKIIILDYHLNSKKRDAQNGLEILRIIRKHDPAMRVLMLSSQDDPEVAANVMKYGAYDYIVKNESAPYRLENILKHLTAHLILDQKLIMNKLIVVLIAAMVLALLIGLAFLI